MFGNKMDKLDKKMDTCENGRIVKAKKENVNFFFFSCRCPEPEREASRPRDLEELREELEERRLQQLRVAHAALDHRRAESLSQHLLLACKKDFAGQKYQNINREEK